MTWLAENALVIWMAGAVALTMALIVFFQTRTNGALYGVVAVVLVTAVFLVANRIWETPREAVERTLYNLAATIETNDVQGALKFLSPSVSAELRKDVETLMPLVEIEMARILGSPAIEMSPNEDAATVRCQGIIRAKNKQDGMVGGAADKFVLQWVRSGDRWLLESYTSDKDWNAAVKGTKVRSK
jgi:hypothetical protein